MTRQHIVFLTGAGISAESGLSTFRGKAGLWTNGEFQYFASTDCLYNETEKCLDFYNMRRKKLSEVEPNVAHFSFNIIGTFLFAILCVVTPLIHWMQSISPDNVPAQIANLHTLFNIVTTILLLPFGQVLATIAKKILPDRGDLPI